MTSATSSRPTIDRTGATKRPTCPIPYGSPGARRVGADRAGHAGATASTVPPAPRPGRAAASGCEPGRRHVADLELERLEAAEPSAGQPGDDVEPIALADDLGDVRPAERDAVEDVAVARSVSWLWPPVAARTRVHGQAEDRDERLGVARAARRETGELAVAARSRRRARAGPGRSRATARGSGGAALGGEGQEALAELVPAVGRRARSRPRRRGRRSG